MIVTGRHVRPEGGIMPERGPDEPRRFQRAEGERDEANDRGVEGYERRVTPGPDTYEPNRKKNVHAATIVAICLVFAGVLLALLVGSLL